MPRFQHVYRTRALGTVAELVVTPGAPLVAAADLLHRELDRIDRVASRFRADSELSRLNRSAGRTVTVSIGLLEAIEVALSIAAKTGGLVDPTVCHAMERLGYDRDFDDVRAGVESRLPCASPVPGWKSVLVDSERRTVTLPRGVALDLGSSAKALAADRAASAIACGLGYGVLVSLGGDVSVAGPAPAGGFRVALADTFASGEVSEAISVTTGGLATSGIGARKWTLGGHVVHHIVDPATGLPAAPWWRTVSVAAATCVEANAASTAAIVLGRNAPGWLQGLGLPARLVHREGRVTRTSAWPAAGAEFRSNVALGAA